MVLWKGRAWERSHNPNSRAIGNQTIQYPEFKLTRSHLRVPIYHGSFVKILWFNQKSEHQYLNGHAPSYLSP